MEKQENKKSLSTDSDWMHQCIMWKCTGDRLSHALMALLNDLGTDLNQQFEDQCQHDAGVPPPNVEDNPHFQLLRECSKVGGDINLLSQKHHLVKKGDGWMVTWMENGSAGLWLKAAQGSHNATGGCLSKNANEKLASIGIIWD